MAIGAAGALAGGAALMALTAGGAAPLLAGLAGAAGFGVGSEFLLNPEQYIKTQEMSNEELRNLKNEYGT
jgi:hypothetical protein